MRASIPWPGLLGSLDTVFPGLSSIVDDAGEVRLGAEVGTISATGTLVRHRRSLINPLDDRWAAPCLGLHCLTIGSAPLRGAISVSKAIYITVST